MNYLTVATPDLQGTMMIPALKFQALGLTFIALGGIDFDDYPNGMRGVFKRKAQDGRYYEMGKPKDLPNFIEICTCMMVAGWPKEQTKIEIVLFEPYEKKFLL